MHRSEVRNLAKFLEKFRDFSVRIWKCCTFFSEIHRFSFRRGLELREPERAARRLREVDAEARVRRPRGLSRKIRYRIAISDFAAKSSNFRGLVLRCINADFCDQILILQHFSRSARCAHFAPLEAQKIAKFQQTFAKLCRFFPNFAEFFRIPSKFQQI